MVADAFDDDGRAAVSDAEAFPGFAGDEGFPACRAEESDVSDDDIFKCVIDTSEEDTDDDTDEGFLKYIEEKKFLY